MAEDAFVTDFEHIMADDITDDVRFIMYDSESGKTASAGEVSKYMTRNIHVDPTLTEEGSAAEAKAVGDALATKADTRGRYEDLIVGGAEQLMADEYETDKEPYLFRTTGGSADVGNREYLDSIVGGTVAWNQLTPDVNTSNWVQRSGQTTGSFNIADGVISFLATAINGGVINTNATRVTVLANHVYLQMVMLKMESGTGTVRWRTMAGLGGDVECSLTDSWVTFSKIKKPTQDIAGSEFTVMDRRESDYTTWQMKNPLFIDLTQMLGTTIADYIYSLEQANAGAGVAWFRRYFPNDYYPYDPGTLRSVEGVSAHETVGFNQWDEQWEVGGYHNVTGVKITRATTIRNKNLIPVLPNTTYHAYYGTTGDGLFAYEYDADGNYIPFSTAGYKTITNRNFTTSENCRYINFCTYGITTTTYKNDICINLSWDGERDGEYEAYVKHSYPLDSSLTLRGIPKLDANGNLYYDGDTYESDGTVTRKYGVVDLGTLNWVYDSTVPMFYSNFSMAKASESDNSIGNIFCPKYQTTYRNNLQHSDVNKAISINSRKYISVKDTAYTDATAFKTAMSGVYLVYELATPTTETADGYEQYQICDPSGTEEFVTTGIVPVGHETRYPHDLKKKIETAPDSPSTDGTYLMKRSGGKNTYMALPSTPSANGSYVLTVTVNGGSVSYSWTAKE